MERFEPGMMAWSRAGHDNGTLYVILEVTQDCVFLTDGRLRPLEKPKKKKKKHVQVIRRIPEELAELANGNSNIKNEDIRRVIRRFSNV
ncbi:MAG: KOW domain-containing RNA-binding protein [Eubacteriales bacterium]|nr:KOW domain-containing RNA-binding protein [Eubacteriales bacterium]